MIEPRGRHELCSYVLGRPSATSRAFTLAFWVLTAAAVTMCVDGTPPTGTRYSLRNSLCSKSERWTSLFILTNWTLCHFQTARRTSFMLRVHAHTHVHTTYNCRRLIRRYHRRRSGWTSGGTHGEHRRWVRVEWGGIWGGVSLSSRLRGLGERRELPHRGPGQSRSRKRILAYFEDHRTLIFVPIWQNLGGGGQFVLAFPAPNSGGTCLPVPTAVIYAYVRYKLYNKSACARVRWRYYRRQKWNFRREFQVAQRSVGIIIQSTSCSHCLTEL